MLSAEIPSGDSPLLRFIGFARKASSHSGSILLDGRCGRMTQMRKQMIAESRLKKTQPVNEFFR